MMKYISTKKIYVSIYFLIAIILYIPTASVAQDTTNLSGVTVTGSSIDGYIPITFDTGAPLSLVGDSLTTWNHEFITSSTATSAIKQKNKDPCDENGKPIRPQTGTKVETYPIFSMPGEMGLRFVLYYDTSNSALTASRWSDNFQYRLDDQCDDKTGPCGYTSIYRPDGSVIVFRGGASASTYTPVAPSNITTLTRDPTTGNFTFHDEDATVQVYSSFGALQTIKDASGVGWTFSYTSSGNNIIETITHTDGQSVTLTSPPHTSGPNSTYGQQLIVTDPSGQTYSINLGDEYTPNANAGDIASINFPGAPSTVISFKYTQLATAPYTTLMNEVDYNGTPYAYTSYVTNNPVSPYYGWASSTYLADGTENFTNAYSTDSLGLVQATITNPLGHVSTQNYDGVNGPGGGINAELTSIKGEAAQTCGATTSTRTYDINGNLAQEVDNNGVAHTYSYAANGQLQTETEAAGTTIARKTDYIWDTNPVLNRKTSVTIEGWKKTAYTYNAQNRLASVAVTNLTGSGIANQTLITTYNYVLYANGMVKTMSVTHPSPNSSDTDTFSYDTLGNLISRADGLGHATTYSSYNAWGEAQHMVGPNGAVTNYAYDVRGRLLTKTTYPYGIAGSWQYTYDGFGLLHTLTTPDGEATTWNRNAEMRVTGITHNDKDGASAESFAYDANGDVTGHSVYRIINGVTDVGLKTNATFDSLGREYKVIGQNGQTLTYSYDGNGNVLSVTDALGDVTRYQYDALNRRIRIVNADGGLVQSQFDAGDNIVNMTDPRGLVTTYSYDGLGQLWQQVSPDTGTTSYVYDSYGRTASMTRANGVQTTYGYDALNRQLSVSAGGQTQSFGYDSCTNGKGLLCSASDATGTTSYSYTPEGWMSGRAFSIGGTTYALGYNYDGEGRLTVVAYPDGNKAIYYRTNGVVSWVQLVVGGGYYNGATAVTYRPADMAMASWTSSNGLVNTLGYDTDGRLTGISVPGVQSQSFGYDAANRITHIGNGIDSSMTQAVGYDAMSRITSMSSPADSETYQYDADGNRVSATVGSVSETYAPDANSNRLLSVNTTYFGTAQYGYDAQGNTTITNGTMAYQYSPFNRLSQSGGATFYINPEGQRLRKAGGSTGTTYFAPDPSGDLLAENDNGTWVDYVRLNGRLINRISGGQIDAIHADQVDRPDTVTDASQNVIWHAKNYPFGSTVTLANITLNLGFPGQYYDAETWLWNNGYRDYNSGFGRYIENDPIGLGGGINTYAYVGGNPISLIDPLGLCDQQKCTAARAALAALGQQLSSAGNGATWTGIGIVVGSGAAALVAPEGAPAEYLGAETGAGLIGVGGTASSIGSTLTGYARGGVLGGTEALGASFLLGRINKFASGLGAVSGVTKSTGDAIEGLLEQASDGVVEVKAQCDAN